MSAPHLPPVGPATASDVYTQSQETTVSALTAFTSIVDLSVVGEEEDPELPPLTSIFHCSMIEESTNSQNGKICWLCKWCGKTFSPRHQSRALCHVLKIRGGDIGICIARIPKFYEDRYRALYDKSKDRMASKKRSHTQIDDAVQLKQTSAVANLLEKRGVTAVVTTSPSIMSIHSVPSVQSDIPMMVRTTAAARGSIYNTPFALSSQRSISASIQNTDIRKSHNAIVEMAIADFFHCENIPDAVAESSRFKRLVKVCRHVGDDFVVPNRKKIGGELLDINYENTYNLNKAELIREARVFGFAWMGDGATIHKMPLMNILALNGTTPPMTVSIHDCTKHMEAGGKKDATFIAELFEVKVLEYDPQLLCTDVFYFDGASNVQKAGEILMAKFPRSFCFHGGEHVVSLFFSSIAKIKPVKVVHHHAMLLNLCQSNTHLIYLSGFDSQNVQVV